MVMETLAIVANRYPDARLLITGNAGKPVIDLARKHRVRRNVHFTGLLPMEELPWHLGCADPFVFPFSDKIYNRGRWLNKIGDYMSLERPTVSNPVGDIKALFENEDTGLLAEWDPTDFAEKIVYLVENPRMTSRLGEDARELAVRRLDWKMPARDLEKFYSKVLDMKDQPVS